MRIQLFAYNGRAQELKLSAHTGELNLEFMRDITDRGRILLAVALLVSSTLVTAAESNGKPDYAREQRLAEQTVDAILDGDAQMLTTGGREFLSIYTEAETEIVSGTVILMHGRGMHPDWEYVINPLRVGLISFGWNTLSIQMPVLEKAAKYYDYVPLFEEAQERIERAIVVAKQRGAKRVVLLAHSCSVHMSMHFVRNSGASAFDAYVGIGMGATDYRQPMHQPLPLAQLQMPVLDVFGATDFPAVLRLAPQRKQAAQHRLSQQLVIDGADHYFKESADELLAAVAAWLDTIVEGDKP